MKGAVFDWDGTLASIDEREFYCINHALTEHGSEPINNEFYVKNYYLRAYEEGTGPRMVLETALTGKGRPIIEAVYESYRRVFQATAEKATLQTGANEILKALKRVGFKIGIATMRYTKWVVESELKHLGVTPLVDLLLTRQDLGVGGTLWSLEETVDQRARLVTKALGEIRLSQDDAFLVGDSWWDVRAGKKLGIRTVLVRTGFASYNDFSKENPDLTVSSMNELREVLEKRHWAI
ncbi:MAG TPA: HAD family hydrolase [Candidatus Bathyarchaeia archaeon]|nr:HAD family hydrolase [Candidatus Bathyarchaeia archaeon]